MRVLVTAETLRGSITGIQRYAIDLVRGLSEHPEVEVTVLLQHPGDGASLPPEVPRIIHPVPQSAGLLPFGSVDPKLLRDFDVIHSTSARVPYFRRPAGRLVMTVHDIGPMTVPASHSLTYRLYFRWGLPLILRRVDHVLVPSTVTRDDIIETYDYSPDRVTVVFGAARWAPLRPADVIRDKGDYFLFVGSDAPRKNLPRTIEAFLGYRERNPGSNARLLIAGQSFEQPHPSVESLGFVEDARLRGLLMHARGLVLASLYEGFGLPVVEAMALGCPVLCSNVSSLPEVAGDAAILCDPCDASSIARGLEALSDERRRNDLIDRGLVRASRFTPRTMAHRTVEVYRSLLAS